MMLIDLDYKDVRPFLASLGLIGSRYSTSASAPAIQVSCENNPKLAGSTILPQLNESKNFAENPKEPVEDSTPRQPRFFWVAFLG